MMQNVLNYGYGRTYCTAERIIRMNIAMMTDPGLSARIPNNDLYEILRDEILSLRLVPGSLLSENAVCKRFNISRTPVRGVFERLRTDGFLEVIPKKGTFVTLIDLDLAEQIIYMRLQVEMDVMAQLAARPNPQLLEKLARNLEHQKLQLELGIVDDEFFRTDSKFHELCMITVGKYKLWQLIQHMGVHYSRYQRMDYKGGRQFDILYREHLELYEALRRGDAASLRALLTAHLYGGILRAGGRLATEYAGYFADTARSIDEIVRDVKKTVRQAAAK